MHPFWTLRKRATGRPPAMDVTSGWDYIRPDEQGHFIKPTVVVQPPTPAPGIAEEMERRLTG